MFPFSTHLCYLRFTVDTQHYQLVALPFGLSTVPWAFFKMPALVLPLFSFQGINLTCEGMDTRTLPANIQRTMHNLQWFLKLQNPCYIQILTWSVWAWSSLLTCPRFFFAWKDSATSAPVLRLCSAVDNWSSIFGLGSNCVLLETVPYTQVYSKLLQRNILAAWDQRSSRPDRPSHLTGRTRFALAWWVTNLTLELGKSPPKFPSCQQHRIEMEGIPVILIALNWHWRTWYLNHIRLLWGLSDCPDFLSHSLPSCFSVTGFNNLTVEA